MLYNLQWGLGHYDSSVISFIILWTATTVCLHFTYVGPRLAKAAPPVRDSDQFVSLYALREQHRLQNCNNDDTTIIH